MSCATRFFATELNATRFPSPDTTPQQLEPLPCAPADDKLTVTLDATTPAAACLDQPTPRLPRLPPARRSRGANNIERSSCLPKAAVPSAGT